MQGQSLKVNPSVDEERQGLGTHNEFDYGKFLMRYSQLLTAAAAGKAARALNAPLLIAALSVNGIGSCREQKLVASLIADEATRGSAAALHEEGKTDNPGEPQASVPPFLAQLQDPDPAPGSMRFTA